MIHQIFTEISCTMVYRNFCSKASVQKFLYPIVQKNLCEKYLDESTFYLGLLSFDCMQNTVWIKYWVLATHGRATNFGSQFIIILWENLWNHNSKMVLPRFIVVWLYAKLSMNKVLSLSHSRLRPREISRRAWKSN